MTLGNRIKELRSAKQLTQEELGKLIGVSKASISLYESDTNTPSNEILEKLTYIFNVSYDFLITGDEAYQTIKIPVFYSISAGNPILTNDQIVDYEEIPSNWKNQGDFFGLRIRGKSMEPRFFENDIAIVRKQCDINSGDLAIVLIDGEEATFKQVLKNQNGITLVGFNTSVYLPKFYSNEDILNLPITIIGKVVELRAKF